jgi:hypothetical protein
MWAFPYLSASSSASSMMAQEFYRYDWGDPIHEFYKLALFSREVSIPFQSVNYTVTMKIK